MSYPPSAGSAHVVKRFFQILQCFCLEHCISVPVRWAVGRRNSRLPLPNTATLVDLGGELYGPACCFSYSEPSPSRDHVIARTILVRANLTSCSGQRDCGAWGAMACVAPQYTGPLDINGAADVVVEVTINGQDFTSSIERSVTTTQLHGVSAALASGDLTGNTSIQIHGQFLQIL